jgi:uncharacterized protein involved in tolerance to divalent cations
MLNCEYWHSIRSRREETSVCVRVCSQAKSFMWQGNMEEKERELCLRHKTKQVQCIK